MGAPGAAAQRATFAADGLVTVPGVLTAGEVAAMRDRVWAMLAGHGVVRHDPTTWTPGGTLPLVELSGALRPGPGTEAVLWAVGREAAFAPLPAALGRAVDEVFGAGVFAPVDDQHGGLAAPNLPIAAARWTVPHAAWHVDEPTAAARPDGWALLAFAVLDEVAPGGGGTVAIAGSHRRLGVLAAERARAGAGGLLTTEAAIATLARDEPWFADLFRPGDADERQRRFVGEGTLSRGIPLRVVELTGQPGDLVLMDPRCLHTGSANTSSRARLTMRLTCARIG